MTSISSVIMTRRLLYFTRHRSRLIVGLCHDERRTLVTIMYMLQAKGRVYDLRCYTLVGLYIREYIHISTSACMHRDRKHKHDRRPVDNRLRLRNIPVRTAMQTAKLRPSFLSSCSTYVPLPRHNNNRREERCYDNRDHRHGRQ